MNYWLFKSEPDVFSIDHLANRPNGVEPWDGVRNYQARNFLRDKVKQGDLVFFYHSSCKQVGIAGVAEVVRAGYPDALQFDPESAYYDPKSTNDSPRWYSVDVKFRCKFTQILRLQDIKANPAITQLGLINKGHRLSVMPVIEEEWFALMAMAEVGSSGL